MSEARIGAGLEEVRTRMAAACERAGRAEGEVTLVAVSKSHPAEAITAAYEAGQRVFGENRAQELTEKSVVLPPDVEWHFLGPLQRNKVRRVRPVATLLHSLDRLSLAEAWIKGPGAAPPVLVQVRLGGESTKHGFEPEAVVDAVGEIVDLGLTVRGLMTIPPPSDEADGTRAWFVRLRELRDEVLASGVETATELSMGMSADFEAAIEEGATLIRVGSTIFGARTT